MAPPTKSESPISATPDPGRRIVHSRRLFPIDTIPFLGARLRLLEMVCILINWGLVHIVAAAACLRRPQKDCTPSRCGGERRMMGEGEEGARRDSARNLAESHTIDVEKP
jgi:hypothetical protein